MIFCHRLPICLSLSVGLKKIDKPYIFPLYSCVVKVESNCHCCFKEEIFCKRLRTKNNRWKLTTDNELQEMLETWWSCNNTIAEVCCCIFQSKWFDPLIFGSKWFNPLIGFSKERVFLGCIFIDGSLRLDSGNINSFLKAAFISAGLPSYLFLVYICKEYLTQSKPFR